MTYLNQPYWSISPYSMRQSPHGYVLGCKEYNSNININGRNIQGVPYHARQRQRSFTIYKCSKQTTLRTITTHCDVLANNKISHAIASLSTNPSCAPKRFRGKNYSHSAAQAQKLEAKLQTHTREIRYQLECTNSEINQTSLTNEEDNYVCPC